MIRPAQAALVERARAFFAARPDVLDRFPEPERVAALSPSAFDELMDLCTARGFRARKRPVLSYRTRELLAEAKRACRIGDFEWTAMLKRVGVAEAIEFDGLGLINMLAVLERNGLDVGIFITLRREITPKQVQLLQVARRQVGMSDADYGRALQDLGGVNSTADLDRRGLALMMALMRAEGFERRGAPPEVTDASLDRRPGFASAAQLGLIRELWREWSGADDEAGLLTWLERYHGVSSLRFLTAKAAGKVITALKAMKRRPQPAEAS